MTMPGSRGRLTRGGTALRYILRICMTMCVFSLLLFKLHGADIR